MTRRGLFRMLVGLVVLKTLPVQDSAVWVVDASDMRWLPFTHVGKTVIVNYECHG